MDLAKTMIEKRQLSTRQAFQAVSLSRNRLYYRPVERDDGELIKAIRALVENEPGFREKAMFGGLASLIGGNMAVAAGSAGGLMVRVDPARTDQLIADGRAARMVMRGREMDGWLLVSADHLSTDDELRRWVGIGVDFARTLPEK